MYPKCNSNKKGGCTKNVYQNQWVYLTMKALRLKALQHAPTSLQKGNGNLKIGKKVLKIDIYCREETNLQSKGNGKGNRIL